MTDLFLFLSPNLSARQTQKQKLTWHRLSARFQRKQHQPSELHELRQQQQHHEHEQLDSGELESNQLVQQPAEQCPDAGQRLQHHGRLPVVHGALSAATEQLEPQLVLIERRPAERRPNLAVLEQQSQQFDHERFRVFAGEQYASVEPESQSEQSGQRCRSDGGFGESVDEQWTAQQQQGK